MFFFEKRTKKLLSTRSLNPISHLWPGERGEQVFLLLFLQKKKNLLFQAR